MGYYRSRKRLRKVEDHDDGKHSVVDRDRREDTDGGLHGMLAGVPAAQLGATCVKALLERTGVPPDRIDEVVMGTCIAAGQGMNPPPVAIFGGLSNSTHAVTINEACPWG